MTEAARKGWTQSDAAWANLGQGMPETGALPGGPARVERLSIDPADLEYAPVQGIRELREAVAAFYNRRYRHGMRSQYTAENVAIAGGGRAAL
ncbi:MAG TPA: pyridoxal phosphate-dependent aminotransferase, partial [bacterium]|nr:pyridoxal phosphate-dependent aminotransferase [bacterium]